MAISRCAKALLGLGLALGLLATAATADPTATTATTSSSTVSAPSVTHTVDVAADGFTYEPNEIYANVSDVILFVFFEGNHSVARAEYEHPCIPYENLGGGRVGFFSGFQPVTGIPAENGPQYALQVNGTEPVFFYCSAPGACVPNGMIGVINPNKTQTLATQELFVKNSSYQLSPGEAPPPESTSSTTSSGSSPTLTSTPTSKPVASSGGGGLSKGAIAGIIVGAVLVIALAALAFYLFGRNRSLASVVRYSQPPQPKHPSTVPPTPYSPDSHHVVPYAPSPGFKPAVTETSSSLPHDSWHTQSTPPMAESRAISPGFPSPYAGGQSPGNAPWSPGGFAGQQYSPVPQQVPAYHQEMATGQEHNLSPAQSPGLPSHDSYLSQSTSPTPYGQQSQPQPQPQQQHLAVHELDAEPAATSTSPPPEYVGRNFSFSEGSRGEAPGVEKVLR